MEEIEKSYLAGIIDGEGTITLTRQHQNQTPSPNVSISNSSLLLKWVKRNVGGWISKKKTYKPHHRQTYVWAITHDKALILLNEIRKYLIIKKPQLVAKIRKLNQR